jgi:hypothetical protein
LDPTWWWRQVLSRLCKYGSWDSIGRLSSYSQPQNLKSDIICLFFASFVHHYCFYSRPLHFL